MLDIETLGHLPGSIVLSIGAVKFCPIRGEIGDTFYTNIRVKEQQAAGLTSTPGTLSFWRKPENAKAFEALKQEPRVAYPTALEQLSDFLRDSEYVWANDPDFDCVLLESLYRAAGSEVYPWKYYNKRSCRTIFHLADVKPDRSVGVAHNALTDSIQQAKAVIKATQILFPQPNEEA